MDGIKDLGEFEDFSYFVNTRPAMYLGTRNADGVKYLIKWFLAGIVHLSGKQDLNVSIFQEDEKTYKFAISGDFNAKQLKRVLLSNKWQGNDTLYLKVLAALSDWCKFTLTSVNKSIGFQFSEGKFIEEYSFDESNSELLAVNFKLKDSIFISFLDFFELGDFCLEYAMLNRQITILLEDNTLPVSNRNIYYFPKGIKRMFENKCHELYSAPFTIFIDEFYKGNYYQIGIAFRINNFIEDNILSYAGIIKTRFGGSLEDGIILGIMKSFVTYMKKKDPLDIDYLLVRKSKKDFKSKLILVCKVECPDNSYVFEGATREKLFMPVIKKDARSLVKNQILNYLNNNPDDVSNFSYYL